MCFGLLPTFTLKMTQSDLDQIWFFYLVEEETISRTVNLELRLKQSKIKIKTLWEKKEVKTIQKLNCHGCWGQSVAYQMST